MKNLNQTFLCAAVIAVAILTISCSKSRLDSGTPSVSTPATAGGIVDLGVVSGDVHHYSVSLTGVLITMPGSNNTASQSGSNVSMELFTKSDGVITDGIYNLTGNNDNTPFTFKSGTLYMNSGDLKSTNVQSVLAVNEGTVSVSRIGTNYTITLQGKVSSGYSFTGHFSGVLSYMDTSIPY